MDCFLACVTCQPDPVAKGCATSLKRSTRNVMTGMGIGHTWNWYHGVVFCPTTIKVVTVCTLCGWCSSNAYLERAYPEESH